FFFSSRRRHTRFSRDWSSDVCSSDLYQRRILVALDNGTAEHQAVFFRILQGITQIGFASQLHIGGGTLLRANQRRGAVGQLVKRSEERRVGKECRCGWSPDD